MKTLSRLLIFLILFSGCSTTSLVQTDHLTSDELNKKINGKQGLIMLTKNGEIKAKNIQVDIDTTSYIDLKTQNRNSMPTSRIVQINIKKRGKGALQGLGIGFLSGACIGSILCIKWGDETDVPCMLVVPPFFGVFAMLPSTLLGTLIGSTEKYILSEPDNLVFINKRNIGNKLIIYGDCCEEELKKSNGNQ
jgi:hypothetical protein